MPLVFGDLGGGLRQFGDLMPGRLGVVGAGLGRQRRLAVLAAFGEEGDGALQPLRGQAPLPVGGMSRLGSGLLARRRLDHRLGCLGWIGRRGQRRVIGVGAEPSGEVTNQGFQLGDALFQGGDSRVTLQASGTGNRGHTIILAAAYDGSCASFLG